MRRPLYGIHPVSPRQHLEDYSKTRDLREPGPRERKAYAIFVWCSAALLAYTVVWLLWEMLE